MSKDFPGFSLPAGSWLPPELLWILPEIRTVADLKVTIAAIHELERRGLRSMLISAIETATKRSRSLTDSLLEKFQDES